MAVLQLVLLEMAAEPFFAEWGATHLLSNGIDMRRELPQRHSTVLRHHARAVQVAQPLVRVGLPGGARAGGGVRWGGPVSVPACRGSGVTAAWRSSVIPPGGIMPG